MFWKNPNELFSQPNIIQTVDAVGTQRREHPGSTGVAGQNFLEKMDRNFTVKDLGGHGRPQKNMRVHAKLLQSYLTACDPMDCSPQAPLSKSCGSAGKESASSVGDLGSIPGLGRFLREGKGSSILAWRVHGVAKSRIGLNDLN